jgi:hypothetical protein
MQTDLRQFLAELGGVIALALVPVLLTAFISMPLTLQYHPGELSTDTARTLHMT